MNPTAGGAGKETSCAAEAAADIENMVGGRKAQLPKQVDGCRTTADVELIDRGEFVHGNGLRRISHVPNAGPNCLRELAVAVMIRNCVIVEHDLTFPSALSWPMMCRPVGGGRWDQNRRFVREFARHDWLPLSSDG